MKSPFYVLLLIMLVNASCEMEEVSPLVQTSLADAVVSEDFNWRTERLVEVNLNDPTGGEGVRYDLFALYPGGEKLKVASGRPVNGVFRMKLDLASVVDQLLVERRDSEGQKSDIYLDASSGYAGGSFKTFSTSSCNELLYAVNGQGGFYEINVENGTYAATALSSLVGGGSIACAVNQDSGIVYYNTGTTLRYYDIDANTFHVAQISNPYNGNYPRMEYNRTNGLLYIGTNSSMKIINPQTNQVLNSYTITGLQSPTGGGDIAISQDGTIYLCCFSGLYRIDINGNNASATRISAENLPFQPTSMGIDRDDRLYLATNEANSRLIEMDKVTGAWTVKQTYNHKVNDLGSWKCDLSQLTNVDSDGDGITDQLDDFPNDSAAAFAVYTPSELGWGSLAFEDMWPSNGDYDFNDLVVSYRYTSIANADNEVVRLEANYKVKAIGAGFRNGFGIKTDIDPADILSVSGYNHTEGIINVDSKGLESGHSDGSVIIVFDDAFDNVGVPTSGYVNTENTSSFIDAPELNVVIEFVSPLDQSDVGVPPFNPFIFVHGDRSKEVHLKDMEPTDLANISLLGSVHDDSNPVNDRYYVSESNLPWAINIIHQFRHPLEKVGVDEGYHHFVDWATSSGVAYEDWYKDNAGYRNDNLLYFEN